jgi:hypothetical protein
MDNKFTHLKEFDDALVDKICSGYMHFGIVTCKLNFTIRDVTLISGWFRVYFTISS